MPTAEMCRKHGISAATFHECKARFGGMDVSEAQRLKSLEDENMLQMNAGASTSSVTPSQTAAGSGFWQSWMT